MASPQQTQARAAIAQLIDKYNNLDEEKRTSLTESDVVTQFIEPLLRALGWPIEDPERYAKELHTQAGYPDLTLFPEAGGTIFVEAKRFGIIQELKEAQRTITGIVTPGQLTLPGMAADRTRQEQQAINYAFENNATWAILTNFERLRLFNARRDWLVLSFEKPAAYLDQFDTLWQLSYESVLNGELDRLSNQRYREDVDTDYLGFINEYRELLAQDAIAHPGANRWAFIEDTDRVNLPLLRDVVQRFLDRLVVVRFAEDHFVLRPGTLKQKIEANLADSYGVQYGFPLRDVLHRFFRQFDSAHNSALFAYDPVLDDQVDFSETVIAGLIDRLYEARYRAMPPDIMGNTYEQYLGTTLVQVDGQIETRANLETRKKQGSYYTPQVIVRHLVDHALGRYLYGTSNGKPDGEPVEGESRKTYDLIRDLRVLDPACGSGSFLIYAYEVLAGFYRAEIGRIEAERAAYAETRTGEGASPIDIRLETMPFEREVEALRDYPRLILERHLYGVDLDPQAAELAAVNLIFRAMEDQRRLSSKRKLPLILNQNVKCGNALIGRLHRLPEGVEAGEMAGALAELRDLRGKLAANSHDEQTMARIKQAAGQANARLNATLAGHFEDVDARRPFNWAVEFPECFVGAAGEHLGNKAGFDVIVGNPPWEIVKPDLREYYAQFDPEIEHPHTTRRQVEQRIGELDADPAIKAGWEAQKRRIERDAAYYRTDAAGYTRQGRGDTATHKLFLERVWGLLADEGRLGYVVPSGIYTDLGTKELREMLLDEGHIQYLYSFSNERFFFHSVHHSFKFTLLGAQKGAEAEGFWATFRFNPRVAVAPSELPSFLANPDNLVYVRQESLERFSPDSLSIMEFQTQTDADVAAKLYGQWSLLGEGHDAWNVDFAQDFHITNDREYFNDKKRGLPLYEGKMIHQFDSYYAETRYWVDVIKGKEKLSSVHYGDWYQDYRVAFREIARSTDIRTCIASVLPKDAFATITLWTVKAPSHPIHLFLVSILNSFCFDFLVRFRVGTHMTLFLTKQLPLPRLTPGNPYFDAIVPRAARLTCTTAAFAGLWREVMGGAWDESKGATDPDERQRLRDEIDALVAHLYGLSREDFAHILGTFPLVFPGDAEGHQKKEALLSIYDKYAEVVAAWD